MIDSFVPRPPLAFRVGISGARKLGPDSWEALRPAVARVLGFVLGEVSGLATTPEALAAYSCKADRTPQVSFVLVSPLAEGSDRLVAEMALQMGYRLEAPLPFAQDEYEKDFPRTVETFRSLLARSRAIALDGGRGEEETRSYEAVGRFVVRNCDLLIAIWDGKPAKGLGGTGDVVQFAVHSGVPVWWLDSEGGSEPRLIESQSDLRDRTLAPGGERAERALVRTLSRTILPPPAHDPRSNGLTNRLLYYWSHLSDNNRTPLQDYLHETSPHIWRAYSIFMIMLTSRITEPASGFLKPEGEIGEWWENFYSPPDSLSLAYGDKYRSSYILIFATGFVALIAAVLGLYTEQWIFIAIELLAICFILGLVVINYLTRWHERWISYRLLAELCRKQPVLTSLGWSLPRWELARMASEDENAESPREAWAAWYFTAVSRAAPPAVGAFTEEVIEKARRVGRNLLFEQIEYHRAREARSEGISRKLTAIAYWLFCFTLVIVALEFILALLEVGHWLGVFAILLPAASAALIGIRAYAEFELLAQESVRMQRIMKEAMSELDRLDLSRPLASQDLAILLDTVAMSMMKDIQGWAELFRVKIVEPG